MNIEERLLKLESEIIALEYQVKVQQSIISMQSVPEWATDAVEVIKKSGYTESPIGSGLDYYLIIALLHRRGIL